MSDDVIRGVDLDAETRCAHYGTDEDVIAIRFGCCGEYYACFRCHDELADHPPEPWPETRRTEPAVRCGVCETDLISVEYMRTDDCPNCGAGFNPGCAEHYHVYFEWVDAEAADEDGY